MKVLFFGDIDGKIGRRAVLKILPQWKDKYNPDVVIANADNVTHGKSINKKHFTLLREAGIDVFTAGDHTIEREETLELLKDETLPILRPFNIKGEYPGKGVMTLPVKDDQLLIICLLGQVFIDKEVESPFISLDNILQDFSQVKNVIIDFHAEATSEKAALGWYADGRVSAVLGTHTHVQTADERLLRNGTAFISDVGFCGAYDSVIGVNKDEIINYFLTGEKFKMKIPETGETIVNAVFIDIDEQGKAREIVRLREIVLI